MPKTSNYQTAIESHYGKSIGDVLRQLPVGTTCSAAAEQISKKIGKLVPAASLSWLAKYKAKYRFNGKRGKKPTSQLVKARIVSVRCAECNRQITIKVVGQINPICNDCKEI